MSMADVIHEKARLLPEPLQQEALQFVECLQHKSAAADKSLAQFSLFSASRGMEDESWPEYEDSDFIEKWR